jgi:hypothetical protein
MDDTDDIVPKRNLLVMQIIAGALLFGVAAFLAVALIVVYFRIGPGAAQANNLPIISIAALVVVAMELPLSFIVPGMQTRSALQKIAAGTWRPPPGADGADLGTDASKILLLRQTTLITSLAILEGAAFFGCIAYLVEARPFVLSIVLLAVWLMLVNFPTQRRVHNWIDRQAEQLAQLRQQNESDSVNSNS